MEENGLIHFSVEGIENTIKTKYCLSITTVNNVAQLLGNQCS